MSMIARFVSVNVHRACELARRSITEAESAISMLASDPQCDEEDLRAIAEAREELRAIREAL